MSLLSLKVIGKSDLSYDLSVKLKTINYEVYFSTLYGHIRGLQLLAKQLSVKATF